MKKLKIIIPILAVVIISGFIGINYVLAEKPTSDTPESGATSYIKATYDSIVALGHGSVAAGSWGDWGAYWNRIRSAAEWLPSGNAAVTDVVSGKTFNNNSRTQATGTRAVAGPCSTQGWNDDHGAPVTSTTNCSQTWVANPTPVAGDDNRSPGGNFDPVTGITWSMLLYNNSGTATFSSALNSTWRWENTLTFNITAANATAGAVYSNNGASFTVITTIAGATTLYTTPTGAPAASGTLTKESGTGDATITFSAATVANGFNNAQVGGKTASQLCSERGNGWRLPTQKELMQAYIDGSYFNLTQPSNYFWSATEYGSTTAWYVALGTGYTTTNNKTSAFQLRCVR